MSSIEIKDVTVGKVDGNGVFDQIMQSVNAQLEAQYLRGRITGPDYANVYLGSVQSAMSQAVQFVLGRQTADKQAELLAAQILTELANGTNTTKQGLILDEELTVSQEKIQLLQEQIENEHVQHADTLTDGITAVVGVVGLQKANLVTEEILTSRKVFVEEAGYLDLVNGNIVLGQIGRQNTKADSEDEFVQQKIDTEKANILDVVNAVSVVGLVGKQKDKLTSEINLTDQKTYTEEAQIDDTPNGVALAGLLKTAQLKTEEETDFVTQKIASELAQINDTPVGGVVGIDVIEGVIGKQKALVQKQTDGFDRDAEQKVLKVVMDSWNISQSLQVTPEAAPPGMSIIEVDSLVLAARANSGVDTP